MASFVEAFSENLIEPCPVAEITASGIGRIEFIGGGQSCLVCYRNAINNGDAERVVSGRLFMPIEMLEQTIELMRAAVREAAGSSSGRLS